MFENQSLIYVEFSSARFFFLSLKKNSVIEKMLRYNFFLKSAKWNGGSYDAVGTGPKWFQPISKWISLLPSSIIDWFFYFFTKWWLLTYSMDTFRILDPRVVHFFHIHRRRAIEKGLCSRWWWRRCSRIVSFTQKSCNRQFRSNWLLKVAFS